MKITELLKKEAVKLNVNATDKDNVIDQLIDLHVKAGNVCSEPKKLDLKGLSRKVCK